MTAREKTGVIEPIQPACASADRGWPRFSVPRPVEEFYYRYIRHLPTDIEAKVVGRGYHNAGWAYLEVEVRAISFTKACEYADQIEQEVMMEFHSPACASADRGGDNG